LVHNSSLKSSSSTQFSNRNRLDAFNRQAVKHGYCADSTPTVPSLCDKADQTLFNNIITNSTLPLHSLLPPKVEKHYSTRPRGHCYQLPRKTSVLDEKNFFNRVLYRNILSFKSTDSHFYHYFCCRNSGLSVYYYYCYYYYYYYHHHHHHAIKAKNN